MATEYLSNPELTKHILKFQASAKEKAKYVLIIEDIEDSIKKKKNRELPTEKEEVLLQKNVDLYKKSQLDYEDSQRDLSVDFYLLSENLVRYTKFSFLDPDDALQEGVVICFEKVDRFMVKKGRAFNYMTTCIINHFRQLYRTARNYNELKRKYYDFQQLKYNKTIIKNGKEMSVYHN